MILNIPTVLKQKKIVLLISFTLGICSHTYAESFDRCNQNFYAKTAPVTVNNLLTKAVYDLCFTGFAVRYSGLSKSGLWSASILTPDSLKAASQIKRTNNFHEEERIPLEHRSLLSDYRGSNFDRGHLSPSADRKNIKDQYDSFSLANMSPQSPHVNQEEWRLAEEAVRAFVKRHNQPVYVITGSLFLGNKLRKIGNNVLVPSHTYKVVLFPELNVAGAYVAVNDETGRIDYVSINQLQQYSGVVYFPTAVKSELFNYRFVLPLNSREAVAMKNIRTAASNDSPIFTKLPSYGSAYLAPKPTQNRTQVKQNRLDAANLAADSAISNVGMVSEWVKRILSK